MTIFVQWATILSPIIAVLIAAWMNKKSAEDTEKKIKSLKRLAKIQIETSQIQLNKELYETKILLFQTQMKERDLQHDGCDNQSFNLTNNISQVVRGDKKRELSYEKDHYQYYSEGLEKFQKRLSVLSKQLEEE